MIGIPNEDTISWLTIDTSAHGYFDLGLLWGSGKYFASSAPFQAAFDDDGIVGNMNPCFGQNLPDAENEYDRADDGKGEGNEDKRQEL